MPILTYPARNKIGANIRIEFPIPVAKETLDGPKHCPPDSFDSVGVISVLLKNIDADGDRVGVVVNVGIIVGVGEIVGVAVFVAVAVGKLVGVAVLVGVGVFVGVAVAVGIGVNVGVGVGVGIGVNVGTPTNIKSKFFCTFPGT